MSKVKSSPIYFLTGSASPGPISLLNISVILSKFMPSKAVRFCFIYRRKSERASQKIFFVAHGLKMVRVYARTITAKVIELFSRWNFSFNHFVSESVALLNSFLNIELSVSFVFGSRPYPASFGFFNLRPEPNLVFFVHPNDYYSTLIAGTSK